MNKFSVLNLSFSALAFGFGMNAAPAFAASFTGYTSSPTGHTLSPNVGVVSGVTDATKADIRLDSVTKGSTTYTNFFYVTGATIITNDNATLGPGSSDRGDQTALDPFLTQGPVAETPNASQVVQSLGNNNLNSIIDTEDNLGTSIFDVYFSNPTDTFAFWERGKNSRLKVTAIVAGSAGNLNPTLGGSFTITQSLWANTGIMTTLSIDTTEIGGAQELGTYGLTYDSAIVGLRLESTDGFNGPDYKVVGINAVPEPLTILGAGTAVAFGGFFKRKLAKSNENKKA
ncbi:PEP-CTERM sorting domain-containing protein [Aphanothece hegewaldii CCALA 016]|uniref:PEP-CTERM sorting domain-containing protein n=1 Tax=Aphanothece hegewaldii CCALA 016 TaxID=2107694 RepID=A0A2T1LZH6_9CHRO|nr:exosortase-dependent surface protein XDP2 [Aphanothece hegewaldii]PSF37813.1 PEP-CTERM sorting domain-containing protein [Aphanothece hegewaldii CCALA 016]